MPCYRSRLPLIVAVLAVLVATVGCGAPSKPLTASAVVADLKSRGVPIGESVDLTAESDANNLLGRPNGYLSKTTFIDGRLARAETEKLSADDGGTVEVFSDADGARRRKAYIDALGKGAPVFGEYNYLRGPVLVRVSRRLTPDQARTYEAALQP